MYLSSYKKGEPNSYLKSQQYLYEHEHIGQIFVNCLEDIYDFPATFRATK